MSALPSLPAEYPAWLRNALCLGLGLALPAMGIAAAFGANLPSAAFIVAGLTSASVFALVSGRPETIIGTIRLAILCWRGLPSASIALSSPPTITPPKLAVADKLEGPTPVRSRPESGAQSAA